ncbi:MAG: hypothetical protein R3F13_13160 [Prosthecobacter sp.]
MDDNQTQATIAELNQRCVERTTGLLALVSRQSLEIAQWRCAARDHGRALQVRRLSRPLSP